MQTRAVEDISDHPFKFYYDFGIRVTLNTDNRLVTNTTVTDEFMAAIDTFQLDAGDVRQIVINGFKSAFLPFHERQAALRKISQELDQLLESESEKANSWSEDEKSDRGQALDLPKASSAPNEESQTAPLAEA